MLVGELRPCTDELRVRLELRWVKLCVSTESLKSAERETLFIERVSLKTTKPKQRKVISSKTVTFCGPCVCV